MIKLDCAECYHDIVRIPARKFINVNYSWLVQQHFHSHSWVLDELIAQFITPVRNKLYHHEMLNKGNWKRND